MAQQMHASRKSLTGTQSNIPRRSSTAAADSNRISQQQSFESINRQSSIGTGRPSSVGTGRLSTIGRPSMSKSSDKPINSQELVQIIIEGLDESDYNQTMTPKILMLPSTGTFYTLFEFFLKTIGINDVWNTNLLPPPPNAQKSNSQPPAQSQNAIAQNKARIDLVIHHLTILKYNNIPKQNVLQTMTTPKNWICVLQILVFLSNICKFLKIYDAHKILNSFDKNNEIINEHLKKMYQLVQKDETFVHSDDYKKHIQEALDKYETQLRGNINLRNLEAEREKLLKTFAHYDNSKNEYDDLLQEEQDLLRALNEEENKLNEEKTAYEERCKRIKKNQKDIKTTKEKLKISEEDIAKKDAEYDKQIASGRQNENLPMKNAKIVRDLEQMQNNFFELEHDKNEVDKKVTTKTEEIKKMIVCTNELVRKIRVESFPELNFYPESNLKAETIQNYKEHLFEKRGQCTTKVCDLNEELAKTIENNKLIASKILKGETEMQENKKDIKHYEYAVQELKSEQDKTLNILKKKANESLKRMSDNEDRKNSLLSSLEEEKTKLTEFQQNLKSQNETIHKDYDEAKREHEAVILRANNDLGDKEKKIDQWYKEDRSKNAELKKILEDYQKQNIGFD